MIQIIECHHVIVLIIPGKCPRTDNKPVSVMSWNKLFVNIPFKIFEPDFLVLIDCGMNIIHIIIHGLIHCLYPIVDIHLTLQLLCLMLTDKALNFCNQLTGFCLGDKLRRLNRINKKFYFCKFKFSGTHMIISFSTNLLFDNLNPKLICHILKVCVDTFSFCCHIIFF